jgi:restriction system protein
MAYVALKYWVPTLEVENPLFRGIAMASPNVAMPVAFLLVVVAAVSAFHSWRKGELIESQTSVRSIQELSWKEFEYLVGEAYKRKGYRVLENTQQGPDQGIDLVLSKDSEVTLVQCKNWKTNKVGVSVVREHFGVVMAEGASRGIVVCSGSFTEEAKAFGDKVDIELIGGRKLAKLISSVQTRGTTEVPKTDKSCPICGSHMVHRVARRGKNAGKSFLGCSRFPKCKGTRG